MECALLRVVLVEQVEMSYLDVDLVCKYLFRSLLSFGVRLNPPFVRQLGRHPPRPLLVCPCCPSTSAHHAPVLIMLQPMVTLASTTRRVTATRRSSRNGCGRLDELGLTQMIGPSGVPRGISGR